MSLGTRQNMTNTRPKIIEQEGSREVASSDPAPRDAIDIDIDIDNGDFASFVGLEQGMSDDRIGQILVESGLISAVDMSRILAEQQASSKHFGEIALAMGLVNPDDLKVGLALQHRYPYIARGPSPISPEIVMAYEPEGPVAEAMRTLRSEILMRTSRRNNMKPIVAVTSVCRSEGRSFVAANLAVSFAQLGHRTLLIDANLRAPAQHELFNLPIQRGLSTILSGRGGLECVQRMSRLPGLAILTAGPIPPNPLELLSYGMGTLLDEVRDHYETILIDTPAASTASDATVLASHAGSTLIVARRHVTPSYDLADLAHRFGVAGVAVLGLTYNES